MRKKGFSLVELLIVISILGIMAAIVIPTFQGHFQKAKEAAAKDNLRILRTAIETYAAKNNGIPPGYPGNDPTQEPMAVEVFRQLADPGEYLKSMPENPFNDMDDLLTYGAAAFPAAADGTSGWMYKPATKEIRLNWTGVDSNGVSYFEY